MNKQQKSALRQLVVDWLTSSQNLSLEDDFKQMIDSIRKDGCENEDPEFMGLIIRVHNAVEEFNTKIQVEIDNMKKQILPTDGNGETALSFS